MTFLEQLETFGSWMLALRPSRTRMSMNRETYVRLTYRYGVETRGTADGLAAFLSGIPVEIDDKLPWNIIEERTYNKWLEVVKTERFPAFAPDPIRDLEGKVIMP